jgi:transcription elongation GreA/GreB family factor
LPETSRRYTPGEWATLVASLLTLIAEDLPKQEARLRRLEAAGDDLDDEWDDAIDDHLSVHSGIETLARTIRRCETISAEDAARADYVRPGSRVVVRTEDGKREAYEISSPYGYISGRGDRHSGVQDATFGKRAGDTVRVVTQLRTFELEIICVEQHPLVLREAESATHLDASAE